MRMYYKNLLPLLLMASCDCSKDINSQNTIVAQIDDKVITAREFKMRSELTIRPPWCRSNSEKHKRIILNCLIAEKLLAIESANDNPLLEKEPFQAYVTGRKEQFMREQLYQRKALDQVHLSEEEIKHTLALAILEYETAYYKLNYQQAELIKKRIDENPGSEEMIFDSIQFTSKIPHKTVKYDDPDDLVLHDTFFAQELEKGQVIGPVRLNDGSYFICKIIDANYAPAIS